MTVDFEIVDCHAHIFPPLAGACGLPDAATHLVQQQRAMHVHGNQPYRRARDNAIVTERPLWDPNDCSEAGRRTDRNFRVGRCGRFEWTVEGEDYYVQFLPPYMADMSMPAEVLVRSMDYAGIATAVLQNDKIYGNLAEDFAQAAKDHPGRFIGLAQVEEPYGYHDDQIARLRYQVETLGMRGFYFTMTAMFRSSYNPLPDDPAYDPLWREVARLDLPTFWVHAGSSPVGTYDDEMRHLAKIVERHPTLRHVLVHGVPTGMYADEQEKVALSPVLDGLLKGGAVTAEILYPIQWGGRMPYPYARAQGHIRQLIDRYGPRRFVWGSDMPNVERYCTYRQTLTYFSDNADYLSAEDRRLIFRENALALFRR
jgi:predicted TIM-barrel fold metal-dependent hydrolase